MHISTTTTACRQTVTGDVLPPLVSSSPIDFENASPLFLLVSCVVHEQRHELVLTDEEAEAAIGCNEQTVLVVLERVRKYLTSLPTESDAATGHPSKTSGTGIGSASAAASGGASTAVIGAASNATGLQKSPRRDRRHSHGNCNGYLSEAQLAELQQQYATSHPAVPVIHHQQQQQQQYDKRQRQAPRKLKVTEQRQQQQHRARFDAGRHHAAGVASSSSRDSNNGRAKARIVSPSQAQSMMATRRRGPDPHAIHAEEHHGYVHDSEYGSYHNDDNDVYENYNGSEYNNAQYAPHYDTSYPYSDELIDTSPRLKAMFSYEHDDNVAETEALQVIEVVPQRRHNVRERKNLVAHKQESSWQQRKLPSSNSSQQGEMKAKGARVVSNAKRRDPPPPQQQQQQIGLPRKRVGSKKEAPQPPRAREASSHYGPASNYDDERYEVQEDYYCGGSTTAYPEEASGTGGHYGAYRSSPSATAAPFVFGNMPGNHRTDVPASTEFDPQPESMYQYPANSYAQYGHEERGMYGGGDHMYSHGHGHVPDPIYAGGPGMKGQCRVVDYQPYTQEDYEELIQDEKKGYWMLGKLGPDYDPDELAAKREMADKRKAYARNVRALAQPAREAKKPVTSSSSKVLSSRERAKEFAKNVPKPKLKEARLGKVDKDSGEQYCEISELERLEMQHKHDRQRLQMVKAELNYMCLKS